VYTVRFVMRFRTPRLSRLSMKRQSVHEVLIATYEAERVLGRTYAIQAYSEYRAFTLARRASSLSSSQRRRPPARRGGRVAEGPASSVPVPSLPLPELSSALPSPSPPSSSPSSSPGLASE
jgi:hypothetical protein